MSDLGFKKFFNFFCRAGPVLPIDPDSFVFPKNSLPMRLALFLASFLLTNLHTHAQDCKTYFLMRAGNEIEMTMYDKKGEVSGRSVSKVTSVRPNGETLEAHFGTKVYSGKGKEQFSNADVTVTCSKGVYSMDLRNLVPAESMGAMRDMEVRVSGTLAEYPARLEPGMTLKDADLLAEPSTGGVALLKMTISLKNRKVEGKEAITTPAGTYDCYKITYDANLKMGVGVNYQAAEWFAPGFGVVKTETYRNGKTVGSTLLTKITPGS